MKLLYLRSLLRLDRGALGLYPGLRHERLWAQAQAPKPFGRPRRRRRRPCDHGACHALRGWRDHAEHQGANATAQRVHPTAGVAGPRLPNDTEAYNEGTDESEHQQMT